MSEEKGIRKKPPDPVLRQPAENAREADRDRDDVDDSAGSEGGGPRVGFGKKAEKKKRSSQED